MVDEDETKKQIGECELAFCKINQKIQPKFGWLHESREDYKYQETFLDDDSDSIKDEGTISDTTALGKKCAHEARQWRQMQKLLLGGWWLAISIIYSDNLYIIYLSNILSKNSFNN